MKTFFVTGYGSPEEFIWEINSGTNMTQGDIFKIKFLVDPDNLNISNYEDLYTTTETWAEFRLNTDLLGDDASQIDFNAIQPNIGYFPINFIYPKTILANGSVTSTFDYLYEVYHQYEGSIPQAKYEITNNEEVFSINTELHVKYSGFFGGNIEIDEEARVTYNKEWGVLSSYELKFRLKSSGETDEAEILLEITDENILVSVPFGWIAGIPVLITFGVITLRRKKRNKT
ncbi:MAG: hypothetical protein KAU62_04355 [Candidatus Heimdallarchaeota archaeon]|nr:hypothetical protein [Candidatus Heimdallarchaeota archaeon]MCG3255297.1 hypothetical protein [Candidatus Heimdallarchaeota archaeon]MCK4610370.1 hypothetical protein [Candidatus Heimdallarchaeota archaeon]